MRKSKSLLYKFIKKINFTDSCWVWKGARHEWGYGMIKKPNTKKNYKAHRLSWMFFNGSIPKDKYVLHRCDRPSCVNPDHLFLGTLKDNSIDMIKKGRGGGQIKKGQKLSREIRMKMSRALIGNQNAIGGKKKI